MDLGTKNTKVLFNGEMNSLLQESSLLAYNLVDGKFLAIGSDALNMQGRTSEKIKMISPIQSGVISDFESTKAMVSFLFGKVFGGQSTRYIVKPIVLIGIPVTTTEVEINALVDAVKIAGGGDIFLVEQPIAQYFCNDEVNLKTSMVVDIGGGSTKISIISSGEIIENKEYSLSSSDIDQSIQDYLKNKYNLVISKEKAEFLKIKLLNFDDLKETKLEVSGRDYISFLPRSVNVSSVEVKEASTVVLEDISELIQGFLEKATPEVFADVIKDGISLFGGGSQIKGLPKFFSSKTRIKFFQFDSKGDVVIGLSKIFKDDNKLFKYYIKDLILR